MPSRQKPLTILRILKVYNKNNCAFVGVMINNSLLHPANNITRVFVS
jgi:hypothetical protein